MRVGVALVCLASCVVVGCAPALTTFTVPLRADAVVEANNPGEAAVVVFAGLDDVDLDATDEFEDNEANADEVSAAHVSSLNLSVLAPQGANLAWWNSLTVTAVSPDEDDVVVASGAIASGGVAAIADVDDTKDIAAFVQAGLFQLRVDSEAVQPPQETTVRADFTFSVTVSR